MYYLFCYMNWLSHKVIIYPLQTKQTSTTKTLINPVYFQLKHPNNNNNNITTNSILNDWEVNILLVNNVSKIYHYNVMNKQQLDQMACTIKHMSVVPTDSAGHISSKRVTNFASFFLTYYFCCKLLFFFCFFLSNFHHS